MRTLKFALAPAFVVVASASTGALADPYLPLTSSAGDIQAPTAIASEDPAEAAQDDTLYAPIEATDLRRSADGRDVVHLEGRWPYTLVGCMLMKEVEIQQTSGHVIAVRPLATLAPDGDDCAAQKQTKRFSIDTPLPTNLQQGDYTIHVRSLDGNTLSRNVSLQADGPVNH